MKPPIKPYKAKAYRVPANPPVRMRRKTASEEIAEIDAGLPPWEEPKPPPSWWERLKAAWFANIR